MSRLARTIIHPQESILQARQICAHTIPWWFTDRRTARIAQIAAFRRKSQVSITEFRLQNRDRLPSRFLAAKSENDAAVRGGWTMLLLMELAGVNSFRCPPVAGGRLNSHYWVFKCSIQGHWLRALADLPRFPALAGRGPTLERSIGTKPSLSAGESGASRKSRRSRFRNSGSAIIE